MVLGRRGGGWWKHARGVEISSAILRPGDASRRRDAIMNRMRFEAEIARADGVPRDAVRERVYGDVRVVAEWPAELATPEIRVALEVSGDVDRREAPAY